MTNKKANIFATLFLCLWLSTGYAQHATTASGGNAKGSGGSVAYSVGQAAYTAITSPTGSVSQGVVQSYNIVIDGIKETALNILLTVYPNPTASNLTLQIKDFENAKLSYKLFDLQGRLLESKKVIGNETQIYTNALPSATYFLKVLQNNKKIQSFKIIKN